MKLVLWLSEDEEELTLDPVVLAGVPRIGERINWTGDRQRRSGRVEDIHWDLDDGSIWAELVDIEVWGRDRVPESGGR